MYPAQLKQSSDSYSDLSWILACIAFRTTNIKLFNIRILWHLSSASVYMICGFELRYWCQKPFHSNMFKDFCYVTCISRSGIICMISVTSGPGSGTLIQLNTFILRGAKGCAWLKELWNLYCQENYNIIGEVKYEAWNDNSTLIIKDSTVISKC